MEQNTGVKAGEYVKRREYAPKEQTAQEVKGSYKKLCKYARK